MAKIDARRTTAVLSDAAAFRAILLHGDDAGLVRERAERIVRASLGGGMDDPFRLAELNREEAARPGALAAEAAALSMTGGRRVVRLRDATDAHAGPLGDALAQRGEALIVLEGGELGPRSKLRSLAEAASDVAAIACYRERGEELTATLAGMLREAGVTAEPSAISWLADRLGEDRLQTRREIEKLALYVGKGGHVDEEAALACSGEAAAVDLDAALIAATAGQAAVADRALSSAFAEGASPVSVLRSALRHVQRLHEAAAAGGDASGLRPPVFFRDRAPFDRALRLWTPQALELAAAALLEAERRVKTTAFRDADEVVCRSAIAALARQVATRARAG